MREQIFAMTRKELSNYFGSPLAVIFMGSFLAAVLFIFFMVETFFARGIADVRPLFRWMPILLIFLLAALTMRQWSEEKRSGTEELLLTLPVRPAALVLGKFVAVMVLIALALALTLPLPITVGMIGRLDWGPVLGGYLAALLMAGAYAAIGLFISSRTDNQIVALIATVLLGGLFYLIGSRGITDFVGGRVSDVLWSLGTGSRFESIERGVIDLRDLIYYLSIITLFLLFNIISLDSVRWSSRQTAYRQQWWSTALLVAANLILLNFWLHPLRGLRLDLTQQREYTLSQPTKTLISNLSEPLTIRAYISEKTHPLLQPLIPRVEDLLREYELNSGGLITAEVVDPTTDPTVEEEANQIYGIRPTPFQVAGRYESAVINAYFNILLRYGDQDVILGFQDLIEVQPQNNGTVEVKLRNLEYDLTRNIKKVVQGFQSVEGVLAALSEPAKLTLYVTSKQLPAQMADVQAQINTVVNEIAQSADGKLQFQTIDLDDPNSGVTAAQFQEQYQIPPIYTDLFGTQSFYAHLVLTSGEEVAIIYPPNEVTEGEIRNTIETAIKRTAKGFLKVVGIVTPPESDPATGQPSITQYRTVREQLGQEYTVQEVNLTNGLPPAGVDVLLILNPLTLNQAQIYAIDQFLMRGGALLLGTNGYQLGVNQMAGGLALTPQPNPFLDEWLAYQGVTISNTMVLDTQNRPFPVPVTRNVSGFQVQEMQAIPYPFFVDVRSDKMDAQSPIVNGLPSLTLNWVSPVLVDETKLGGRTATTLLFSSADSWTAANPSVQPDFETHGELGFPVSAEIGSQPLAVAMQGRFTSYFADKEIPTVTTTNEDGSSSETPIPATTIRESAETARLIIFGSSTFLADDILNLSAQFSQEVAVNNVQLVQNSVDWSVEDLDLLGIRTRGTATRVLAPLEVEQQRLWEYGNYAFALLALLALYFAYRGGQEEPMQLPKPQQWEG